MKTLRRYKFGYFLATILILISLAAIATTIWNAYPKIKTDNDPFNAYWGFLWTEEIILTPTVQFKLFYLIIFAIVLLISAVGVLTYSSQWFFLPSETKKLQCPFCKKCWTSTYDRGQILCPHCRHLVHPKLKSR